MKPTDTRDPDYYHKVVDCQWACPAHTDVPNYIRLIALGQYTEAYLLNRQSNVFPSILGRVCDRPCEPACRRTRVDGQAVAICRLKRVAADNREDISSQLPKIPMQKNGFKIACIGAGPASLTVANDLMPIGYEVTIFEAQKEAGGLMLSNIPQFRLPREVLQDEISQIINMGVDIRYDSPITSMAKLLRENFNAIFIGTGAPKGKELNLPGRKEGSDNIHIGITWLESVAFGHINKIGEKVLVIGVGNTAMDCCRTSKRLGGKQVKVMARKSREFFKASPWELEDAEEEQIDIIENHSPEEFIIDNGRLVGMRFAVMSYEQDENNKLQSKKIDEVIIPCDDVILAIGQDNAFPWIERDIGIDFNEWDMPIVDKKTFATSLPHVFVGGDAAFGPENIIWAVEHGHQAAISIHQFCHGRAVTERIADDFSMTSRKMGIHQWSYSSQYDQFRRQKMTHVALEKRFNNIQVEVEEGLTPEQVKREVERCLNCDMQTVFDAPECIECDACIDICPMDCLTITKNDEEDNLRQQFLIPAENRQQAMLVSEPLKQTGRVMLKDEDVCVHCGLCAERCPTGAWDMQKFLLKTPLAKDYNND